MRFLHSQPRRASYERRTETVTVCHKEDFSRIAWHVVAFRVIVDATFGLEVLQCVVEEVADLIFVPAHFLLGHHLRNVLEVFAVLQIAVLVFGDGGPLMHTCLMPSKNTTCSSGVQFDTSRFGVFLTGTGGGASGFGGVKRAA